MRFLLSGFLRFVFASAFFCFFALSSIADYIDSPERLILSARESGARRVIVEQTATYIAEQIKTDPSLVEMSVGQLQSIVGAVVTQEWLERSLVMGHGAIKSAIHGAERSAVLDLRGIKAALAEALVELISAAEASCAQLLGAQACADARTSQKRLDAIDAGVSRAILRIDDEIDLMQYFRGPTRQRVREIKDGLESLETVRMLALVVLIMSLAVFSVLRSRPRSTMLLASSAIVALTSGLYLLSTEVFAGIAVREIFSRVALQSSFAVVIPLREVLSTMTVDFVAGSTSIVLLIGICATVVFSLTLILSRRGALGS